MGKNLPQPQQRIADLWLVERGIAQQHDASPGVIRCHVQQLTIAALDTIDAHPLGVGRAFQLMKRAAR